MPWTKNYFPVSMKNLEEEVREKAIEIGNALMEEGSMEEGIAIAIAISRAKDWAANRGKKVRKSEQSSKSVDVKKHGKDRYVVPYKDSQWAIKQEGHNKVEEVFPTKKDAVKRAREETKRNHGTLTIQRRTGTVQDRISYNPNKKVKA